LKFWGHQGVSPHSGDAPRRQLEVRRRR
jgi:hypothetical protein